MRTGNRQGEVLKSPARMAGINDLCSEKPHTNTEVHADTVESKGRGSPFGWPLLFVLAMAPMPQLPKAAPINAPHGKVVVPQYAVDSAGASEAEIAAADGMESMMMDMLMQEMRKTVSESELIPVSQGERVFRQMLDTEYSKMMSAQGSLGIKDLVLAQIRRKR